MYSEHFRHAQVHTLTITLPSRPQKWQTMGSQQPRITWVQTINYIPGADFTKSFKLVLRCVSILIAKQKSDVTI